MFLVLACISLIIFELFVFYDPCIQDKAGAMDYLSSFCSFGWFSLVLRWLFVFHLLYVWY